MDGRGKNDIADQHQRTENLPEIKVTVALNQKLATNYDRIPSGVQKPLIKPHTIDDVPIMALTFHGGNYDHFTLRRLAAQVDDFINYFTPLVVMTAIPFSLIGILHTLGVRCFFYCYLYDRIHGRCRYRCA